MNIKPVTLEGKYVSLEPLQLSHTTDLWHAAQHSEIWQWMPYVIESERHLGQLLTKLLKFGDSGTWLSFVIRELSTDKLVGTTSYLNIEPDNKRLEIGSTWITPAWQRSAVNTECKYLLLGHAFDDLDCIRVEFKTDSLNKSSRRALSRIGAKEEGVFRNHMVMPGGRLRDSVFFGIINSEWPEIKKMLAEKIEAYK
jgi:RimJ/RimL family protein N-acetyltransferase